MKKFTPLVLTFLFFCYTGSIAQFNQIWFNNFQHSSTTSFSNEGRKVASDATGNVFMLMDATSDIDPNGVVTGSTYYYTLLVKYDVNGSLMNVETINVNSHFTAGFESRSSFGLEVDASGNVYCGYSVYNATTNFDIHITKYNNSLLQIWHYEYNPAAADSGVAMKVASSGNVYAVIKSVASGLIRYRILKANSTQTTITHFYSYNAFPDYLNSLAIDASENIYVTGYRVLAGGKVILTASINSAGILRWRDIYNGDTNNFDDIGKNLTIGTNGDLYVTGLSDRSNINGLDVMNIRYNSQDGKKVWVSFQNYGATDGGFFITAPDTNFVYVFSVSSNTVLIDQLRISGAVGGAGTIGGSLIRRLTYNPVPVSPYSALNGVTINDMKASANINFYITGTITATSSGQTFSAAYLAKANFSRRGNALVEFSVPVDGNFSGSYEGSSVALNNPNKQVYWLRNSFGTYSSHSNEIVELFAFDVPSPTRLESDALIGGAGYDGNISLTPNPAIDFISVYSSDVLLKIELLDLAGKTVKSFRVNEANTVIDLSGINQGIYIGRIYSTSGEIINRKIIKN